MNDMIDDDLLALLLADAGDQPQGIAARTQNTPAPLSFAQQRLWFVQQFLPDSAAYNLPRVMRITGALPAQRLEIALNRVLDRHDILRTAFREIDGVAMQVVDDQARLVLGQEDLCELADADRARQIALRIEAQANTPFDLRQAPLMRATLLKIGADEHLLLMNMHHIVSDAWSNAILMQDLNRAFAQAGDANAPPLPRPPIQYADYAAWQRGDYLHSASCANSADYWQNYLGTPLPTLDLPVDFHRSAQHRHPAGKHAFELPGSLSAALNRFCQQQGLSPFVVALGAWQLLLSRYSGQRDFTVGVPNATRNRSETQGLVGFFVSSQVYRVRLDPMLSASDFLHRLRRESLAALDHADYPLELSFDALQLQASAQANPLFQVLFNWRTDSGEPGAIDLDGLALEFLDAGSSQAKFDVSLDVAYSQHGVAASLEYSRDLYTPATIERLARHWQNLLQGIVEDCSQRIGELPLLDSDEQNVMLKDWHRVVEHSAQAPCVQQRIAAQAEQTPDAVALIVGGDCLTYAQLDARANQLANKLIEAGVGPDRLVGISVERSVEMIVGLLAILKAGGAYVPLDPAYPEDRLAYMIEDSGLELLLTQSHLQGQLPIPAGLNTLLLDQPPAWLAAYPQTCPTVALNGEHLAYVIYTSGSTGKPKGVMVRHAALCNFVESMVHQPGIAAQDRMLSLTTFSFDIFGLEIYGPLLAGARVVLTGKDVHQDPQAVLELIERHGVTVLQATPSTWRMLLDHEQASILAGRSFLCGGEALPQELAQRMLALSPKVWNLYGPTETTIWSALHPLTRENTQPYLGKPINNTALYILGSDLELNPIGAPGELLIGGDGLARGYFQRPSLTAERFVPDPFSFSGERLYRTGDLTRYRAEGVIEYIGRIDHQVKIRGFRIELGEIEARLLALDSVRETVVVAQDGPTGPQLVGYVVAAASYEDEAALRAELKASLKAELPEYMVPAHLLFLAQLPQTPNGKVDRKALPLPDLSQSQRPYIAPVTPLENALAELWQEALQVKRVSLDDNFFELGGHSILAIQFISTLHARLGIKLALQQMLAYPTVEELARFIALEHQQNAQSVVALNASTASAPGLFCLHPSGGIVFCYQPLAKKLAPHAKTFGVMHKGFADKASSAQTWAEMIADYSAQIVEQQPHGPYRLMGWSLGGAIAMDIAARLEQQGREVSFLGLVDTNVPERDLPADLPRKPLEEDNPNHLSAQSELKAALEVFTLMFAHLEPAAVIFIAQNPTADLKAFYRWASEQTATEEQEMIATLDGIKQEIMNAQAFAIHERLVAAFEEFSLPRLKVQASCWWSLSHKTLEQVLFSEQLLRDHNATGQLHTSIHTPLPHRSMIYAESLLESFTDVFLGGQGESSS
ncbi:amino acid adenylation domain-containing protein [Pseudomonas frederiksbergensis]|uniref:amino acid adenylation domain-containing protein n=1 Tax=Pseudomonas frederiksbergensis TaxID=104087 RepID=UPI000F4AD650|nr:non-ribosomal peptide synthetase [Pseudomonas frederiksbergensis]RON48841.1 non-ribosomal peptide synthetase [Pseudomonas frederiksbergensis]